jgi:hypothetical protein
LEPGEWLAADTRAAALGLNLIPFAGVSFLWFIGVLRDRLGSLEDRFFATVLLGSAILFLAGLFAAAAAMGAVILTATNMDPGEVAHSATFKYARSAAYIIANVYTAKMAAVFMVSTSTIIIYTRIAPRWIAFTGYGLALALLIVSYAMSWSAIVLPIWVLLISIHILVDNLRGPTS